MGRRGGQGVLGPELWRARVPNLGVEQIFYEWRRKMGVAEEGRVWYNGDILFLGIPTTPSGRTGHIFAVEFYEALADLL